jgi:uncharacterized protein YlzI (FlbEa/FlbD family)
VLVNGSGFISVTVSGAEWLLNVEHISAFSGVVNGSQISMMDGQTFVVAQTLSQLKALITQVRALPPERTP